MIALPGRLKYGTELIQKHGEKLINHSEYRLGKAFETTAPGFRMKVHLYYSPEKAIQEREALYELLERQENDLSQMEKPQEKEFHYDRYFYINRSKEGKMGYLRQIQSPVM